MAEQSLAQSTTLQVLGVNILGLLVLSAWAVLWMAPLFLLLSKLGVLRIPVEMERDGMDVPKHNEVAYPPGAWQGFLPLTPSDDRPNTSTQHLNASMEGLNRRIIFASCQIEKICRI